MALVSDGFKLTITLIDSGGNRANLPYYLKAALYADAVTDTATIIAELLAITDAAVQGYTLAEQYIEDDLAYPAAGVHIENRATITARIHGHPSKTWTTHIPAPDSAIFLSPTGEGSNEVDIGNVDLLAYFGLFEETGGVAEISDGETLADAATIKKGHRTHRQASYG